MRDWSMLLQMDIGTLQVPKSCPLPTDSSSFADIFFIEMNNNATLVAEAGLYCVTTTGSGDNTSRVN